MEMNNNPKGATPGSFNTSVITILNSIGLIFVSGQQDKGQPNGQPPTNEGPASAPTLVTHLQNLGKDSAQIDCPYCHKTAATLLAPIKADPENCGYVHLCKLLRLKQI
jgi:hypothetical protein